MSRIDHHADRNPLVRRRQVARPAVTGPLAGALCVTRPMTGRQTAIVAMLCAGFAAVAFSAIVPHYDAGHRLLVPVLLTGLVPWALFAVCAQLVAGRPFLVGAGLVLAVDLGTRILLRVSPPAAGGYPDATIHVVALAAAALLVALAVVLGRR